MISFFLYLYRSEPKLYLMKQILPLIFAFLIALPAAA